MVQIAPSILSANSAVLGQEVALLQKAQADFIHFDVMDGHFVPNLTFGPKILKDIKAYTQAPFDVHLMVTDVQRFIPWYAEAGADIITFHIEAEQNPLDVIKLIKSYGIKAGLSIKPQTDITMLKPFYNDVDLILIMSVEPGFGGQKFIPDILARIQKIKKDIGTRDILIEVDGGINFETAPLCTQAGADILVAGTAVFANGNYSQNIITLKGK